LHIIGWDTFMKKLAALFVILFCSQALLAQSFAERFIRKMYFDKDSSKRSNFILVPALASSPETGFEFGGAALYSFYSDTTPHNITRVSNLYGYASITTKAQEKISLNANYWSPGNIYHYTAYTGYINFPFDFYGIGNNTRASNIETILERREKLTFEADKRLAKDFYGGIVGGGYLYYYFSGPYPQNFAFKTDPDIQDRHGGDGVYIGPSLVYDTRNNNTYTTSGMVIYSYFNMMHGVVNNYYAGGLFDIDYSQFFLLQKHLVLGLNIKEQSLAGGGSPFYLLPQLGNDALMRGYYTGRYRDRNLLAGQTELRYRINDRFGLDGFLGTGEVAHNSFSLNALKPDYGGGFRYFFDTEKGLTIRADYGIGEKPAGEARESGFYIALGEAF
jgi:hypothetical protein